MNFSLQHFAVFQANGISLKTHKLSVFILMYSILILKIWGRLAKGIPEFESHYLFTFSDVCCVTEE